MRQDLRVWGVVSALGIHSGVIHYCRPSKRRDLHGSVQLKGSVRNNKCNDVRLQLAMYLIHSLLNRLRASSVASKVRGLPFYIFIDLGCVPARMST